MSEFRLSRPSDVPELRRLWQAAFGDADAYLDLFFSTAYAPQRCLVLIRKEKLLGGAHWLSCEFSGMKLAYIYAVAIDPGAQNQGFGTALMDKLHEQLARDGYDAALLVPGSEALRQYYRRFGYETVSHHDEFTAAAGVPVPLTKIDAQHFACLRRQYLPENGVMQEAENLALLDALAFFYEGADFIAAISQGICLELLGNSTRASGITAALGLDRCRFRAPGPGHPYAMGKTLTQAPLPQTLYFGFGFD